METYNVIASWSGWPPIATFLLVLGGIGIWFYQQRIEFLKDEIGSLSRKLQDCLNFTPDVVAQRLVAKHKIYIQEIESLTQEKEQDEERILELNQKLSKTQDEAKNLQIQFDGVQEILTDMQFPREGKVRTSIKSDILKTMQDQSAIYFPLRFQPGSNKTLKQIVEFKPFILQVDFPGMFKMYLNIYDNNCDFIGQVENPYLEIYDKDYYVTLLEILKLVPKETAPQDILPRDGAFVLTTSEFHHISPIDPGIIYIRIPFDKSMLANE